MQQFKNINSRLVPIVRDNIDTDQIIPAQYLKVTDKNDLASGCFASWRYNADGTPDLEFPINKPEFANAQVMLSGDNFGCGSSREHAAWALSGLGIRAVISTSFADIFHNNAIKNGILPVVVDESAHAHLVELIQTDPLIEVEIDLERQTLTLPDGRTSEFPIDSFNKMCLLEGIDTLEYLLKHQDRILAYENAKNI
jgi:3-isopropylmalate/(R)-2-methylmalate dehydratase small subunit